MTTKEEKAERAAKKREDDRELKKVHFFYRSLPAEEQARIDELARHSAELELNARGAPLVDYDLAPLARKHGLAAPSCALARETHRRWRQILREDHGKRIEELWRDRLDRLADGDGDGNVR